MKIIFSIILVAVLAAAMPDPLRTFVRQSTGEVYRRLENYVGKDHKRITKQGVSATAENNTISLSAAYDSLEDRLEVVSSIMDKNMPMVTDQMSPRIMTRDEFLEIKGKLIAVKIFLEEGEDVQND